jgi:hypothetical protein
MFKPLPQMSAAVGCALQMSSTRSATIVVCVIAFAGFAFQRQRRLFLAAYGAAAAVFM